MNRYSRQRGWHKERSGDETKHSMFGNGLLAGICGRAWTYWLLRPNRVHLFPTVHSVTSPRQLGTHHRARPSTVEIGRHCGSEPCFALQGAMGRFAHAPPRVRWEDRLGLDLQGPGDVLSTLFVVGLRRDCLTYLT